jgi:hypothetical protein
VGETQSHRRKPDYSAGGRARYRIRHGRVAVVARGTEGQGLAAQSLWEAADADSSTGGPDALRGIYPIVATVTADGWERLGDDDLAPRFARLASEVRDR